MKTKLILLFTLFITVASFAQTNGINYKAIVKDNNGNVIANTTIDVIISINESSTNIFSEYHTTTTGNNGLFILNIGEGTATVGDFTTIDWSTNNHLLNVQVGIAGGAFIDLGTTAFKSVPYAYKATNADNVTGLENVFENNIGGHRLIGKDPANYGNIGFGAIDLSLSLEATDTNGATGPSAFASGLNTLASGLASISFGIGAIASGDYATAMGEFNTASGNNSFSTGKTTTADGNSSVSFGTSTRASGSGAAAFGVATIANGNFSTAFGSSTFTDSGAAGSFSTGFTTSTYGFYSASFGESTIANARSSFVLGRFNVGGGNTTTWTNTDPLFEIGIGQNIANKANALTVYKNGIITAPEFQISEITDAKALITKEYAEVNFTNQGLEPIDEGVGVGWRLVGRNPTNYGTIGENAVDLSTSDLSQTNFPLMGASGNYSVAMGFTTQAVGLRSVATGDKTDAIGNNSYSMGNRTIANGDNAISTGDQTIADESNSMSLGSFTRANGQNSVSAGTNTYADAFNSMVLGRYNVGGGSATSWVNTDPIFEIGNGASFISRNNIFTILKNGSTTIKRADNLLPQLTLKGYDNSDSGDDCIISSDNTKSGSDLFLRSYDAVVVNIDYDNNEAGQFQIANGAGTTVFEVDEAGTVFQNGTTIHSSDRRLKRNITDLKYGLNEILQLQPKQYFWKNREGQKDESLGVIAQDIRDIIPNVVEERDDTQKMLSVSYTELIPILINAIKEQQQIIDNQSNKIEGLTSEITKLKLLEIRMEQLEAFVLKSSSD